MAKRPRGTGFASFEEMQEHRRANTAMDAYNAGYRRGVSGQEPKSDRYGSHPRFSEGYTDGVADREKQ